MSFKFPWGLFAAESTERGSNCEKSSRSYFVRKFFKSTSLEGCYFDYCFHDDDDVCPLWQKEEASIMNQPVPDELISAYFDGEVTPEERSEVERLLEASPEFRQLLDETSRLSALLHSFPREAAPPELAVNVQKQVQHAVQVPSFPNSNNRRSLRREWTAFSVGILATVASLLMFVRLNPPAGNTDLWTDTASNVSEARRENEKLGDRLDGVIVANTELVARRDRTFFSDKAEPTQLDFKPAIAAKPVDKMNADKMELAKDTVAAGLPALMTNDVDANLNSLQTQIQNEFLASLTNGDVIVPKVADPDNTIAVVDFTVVDILRETHDLKILLQKRSVKQLDDAEDPAFDKRKRSKEKSPSEKLEEKEWATKKASPRSDDFQLFYVRAPGDQLAGAIDEFSKNHPDLNWTPQLPIELPLTPQPPPTPVAEKLARSLKTAKLEADVKRDDNLEDTVAATAEADLVIGAFLARNNAFVSSVDTTLSSPTVDSETRSKLEALATPMQRSNSPTSGSSQPVTNGRNSFSESSNLGLPANGQGYFRVSVQNQTQPVTQPVPVDAAKNNTVPLLANLSVNTNGFAGGMNSRFAYALPNNENRNTRPVKMLIVLKSQQAQPHHAP